MANTKKKEQHYLPKFYLRNFPYHRNKKLIGLFNLNRELYLPSVPLEEQCSKRFFYGHDGVIEDNLSIIENGLAPLIQKIINKRSLPSNKPEEYALLLFVVLTHLRNPTVLENQKKNIEELSNVLLKMDPDFEDAKRLKELNKNQGFENIFSQIPKMMIASLDLNSKLILNKTDRPFICSDYPVVKYNQFLEQKKWPYGKTGFGNKGLQVFIPINHELMIMLYDPIYKVGFKKKPIFEITNPNDIDQLNILQFVNCIENVFFDEKASDSYIRKMYNNSQRFNKPHQPSSQLRKLIKKDENTQEEIIPEKENLIFITSSSCETKLKIDGITMQLGAPLDDMAAQLRPNLLRFKDF